MEASLKLGRIRGILVGIHYTWLVVFGLLTYSLAIGLFPVLYPGWSTTQYWVVAVIAALLLFASVLAHEFGHALVAQSKGIPVRSITLFIFGGVAAIDQESEDAGDEFQIAIAGPAVSILVAIVSGLLWLLTRGVSEPLAAIFFYLGLANVILVVFNLIPGFPLDGGRVFRAIVWRITNDVRRATKIASMVGVGIGYLFIIGGIFYVFSGEAISGIWLVAIGWFLQSAAEQSYQQLAQRRTFEGIQVQMLMNRSPVVVRPDITIQDLVDRYILGRNVRGLPVVEGGDLAGIITLTDVKDTSREEWGQLLVRDRMTPRDQLVVATPQTNLDGMIQAMSERDIHQVPVVEDGALVGLLTRNAVIRFLQSQQVLQVTPQEVEEAISETRRRPGAAV